MEKEILFNTRIVARGDEDARMVLLEDPDGGRVLVMHICDMNIKPTNRYETEELEVCKES